MKMHPFKGGGCETLVIALNVRLWDCKCRQGG